MILCLDREFSEQELAERDQLDLRSISAKIWPTVLSRCTAKELRLYHLKIASLEGIDRLTHTRRLTLEWGAKIESLGPVSRLSSLTHLAIGDFPRLQQLDGLEQLSELKELRLSGSLGGGSPLRLESIEPVTRISGLTRLSLSKTKLKDDDITSLARCTHLRHLSLTNQFDRSQVAFLASRLNEQLVEPLTAYVQTHLHCKKCNSLTSMFTGRRMSFLCPVCDESRFEKLTSQFEKKVSDA